MLYARCYLLCLCILVCPTVSQAGERAGAREHGVKTADPQVRRNYRDTSKYLVASHALVLEGSAGQIMRISRWLDDIYSIPIGKQTLQAIFDSGNQLTIRHSEWALNASGRTQGPASDKLINGQGADVVILFDARIPENGSHFVFDSQSNAIEFTAAQNLFHELVHARHYANGTWRYFDSEGQAIEEENIFRIQHGEWLGLDEVSLRAAADGRQMWWPDNGYQYSSKR